MIELALKSLNVSKKHVDIVGKIIAYESGEMNDHDIVEFFGELVANGMAWTLQGHYGRTASALIEAGYIEAKTGKVLKYPEESD